jgi:hypothetical protein
LRSRLLTLIAAGLLLSVGQAQAQDTDFAGLSDELRANDSVDVSFEDRMIVRGRVLNLSVDAMTLRTGELTRDLKANQVTRVQRRRNGILLGAVIGAAVGVPFGLALKSYAHNEGGSEGLAVLMPIGVGLGAGIGIDALLVKPRTIYERQTAPTMRRTK